MGNLLDRFSRKTIPNTVVFNLTPAGKTKAEDYGSDPKSKVLSALDDDGASTVPEIQKSTGLRRSTVEQALRTLKATSLVHTIRTSDE